MGMKKFILKNKKGLLALTISVLTYLAFFHPMLKKSLYIYSGADSVRWHYPSKILLHESLKKGHLIPTWTEKMFLGYPVYAELERGYLNPVNIVLVKIFGPLTSHKIMHFITYLFGSFFLYKFLKEKGVSLTGFSVANAIYYFSFYHFYHIEHFSLMLCSFLIPSAIYFTHRITIKRNLENAIFLTVLNAYCFYIGSFQILTFSLIAQILYLLTVKKDLLKNLAFFSIAHITIFLPLILPGTSIFLELYKNSARLTHINYHDGSFFPGMLSTLIHPFIFRKEMYYTGHHLFDGYNIHEVYMYLGISTGIISLYAFFTQKQKQLTRFLKYLIIAALIMSMSKYIPIVDNYLPFPLNSYRYLARSLILIVFATAVYTALFISNIEEKVQKNEIIWGGTIAVSLLLIQLDSEALKNLKDLKYYWLNSYEFTYMDKTWLIFAVLTTILLIFTIKTKKKICSTLLVLTVFADLLYFSNELTSYDFYKSTAELPCTKVCDQHRFDKSNLKNKRIIDFTKCIQDTNAFVHNSYSVFGTSSFVSQETIDLIRSSGIKRMRSATVGDDFDPTNTTTLSKLKDIGIQGYINSDKEFVDVQNSVIRTSRAKDITFDEGKVTFTVKSNEKKYIKTYIKHYPGWIATVNGDPTKLRKIKDELFLEVLIPKGNYEVKISYVPKTLHRWSFIAGGILLTELMGFIYIKKFVKSEIKF